MIPPLTQIPIDDNDPPNTPLSQQERLEIQLKKQRPQIALILPQDQTKPLRARDDLKELPKVMMEEKMSQAEDDTDKDRNGENGRRRAWRKRN